MLFKQKYNIFNASFQFINHKKTKLMKEKISYFYKLFVVFTLLILAMPATAQLQWSENFDYTTGNLYGQGGWGKYGSNPNNPIQVVDELLTFDGYPGGVKGKSIKMAAESSSEDLLVRFDPSENGTTSGTIYFSALINVTTAPSSAVYSMSLLTRTKSSVVADGKSPTELGRLFFDKGSAEGKFKLGVERGASKPVFSTTEYDTGKTYLVVMKYEMAEDNTQDKISLFVNPASYTEEPATADAEIMPATGSMRSQGFQGLELRQAGTSSKKAPVMTVGSLRIADTYAGMFATSGGEPTDKPTITLSEKNLYFGTIYQGMEAQKTLNVKAQNLKGDITIDIQHADLTASAMTISASEAESATGCDIVFTAAPKTESGNTKITFSSEGADVAELPATWIMVPVEEKATLKEIADGNPDEFKTYKYKGTAVVTFADNSGETPKYYIQDETAGLVMGGEIAEPLREGDAVTGMLGMISSAFGVITLDVMPESKMEKTATGVEVKPIVTTLAAIKAAPADFMNKLVRIENATFKDVASGTKFTESMTQPVITDNSGEGKMRIFKGTSLIGTDIPTEAVNITGLSTSTSAVIIAPRGTKDIEKAVAGTPEITVTPEKTDMAHGYVGEANELWTIHVKATSVPGEVMIDITGKDRAMFASNIATIAAGSSETDIVVTYNPTAIGKHTARLNIDCPAMPELSTAVSLNAYATDRNNPPTITVTPQPIPEFKAKAGETMEQTITVKTEYLPDYAYMKLETADAFRLGTTMLLKDNTAEVKVTFAPIKSGTFENKIVFSALGVETFNVVIKGTAEESTSPEPEKEGDDLPLETTNPRKLLTENFDGVEKDSPIKIDGWKNLAMAGQRAWWGHEFSSADESAGEKAAKVTPYDRNIEQGSEEPCEMLLVTPPLDFVNADSKVFTFRVRGDYLRDEQTDELELCYIDIADGDMFISPVSGFNMPKLKDESGEWFEYHIDLTNQQLADVFFMGFRFKSLRGKENAATYLIDDVSYGRTDLPVIHLSQETAEISAVLNKDAATEDIRITTNNLTEPVKLSLGGANKSKFKLSATELPAEGGTFSVMFNSDKIGVHEAYVKLSSRGAADRYLLLTADCDEPTGIDAATAETVERIEVYDTTGKLVKADNKTTEKNVTGSLPTGTYIVKATTKDGLKTKKINVK